VDTLADVLEVSRVRGALMATVRARAPWGLALPQSDGASMHAITSGTGWLCVEGSEPLQLMPGDVVMLPAGTPHRVSSEPDGRCRAFDRALKQKLIEADGQLELVRGGQATTTFICAGYDYDHEVAQPLMGLLPAVLHVPADPVAGRQIAAILDLLAGELGGRAPGAETSVARLIDLLLIAAIRAWLERDPDHGGPSWLTALRDPVVARALSLLHRRPGEPWTIESLAREVHTSRATLARRFAAEVGEAPVSYLTRWLMELAARRLRTSLDSVEGIARDVGYTSAYAFNRAFRRHRGVPPGRYRRAAAAQT
jgi:AraC-like DNA-binding protein